MSGYLELPDGGFLGVKDGLVFGRVAACDIVVNDTKASRRHARLIVDAGVVEIEDMDSSNGTLLNGKPVTRRMIRDGDEVKIGKTVIKYREGPLPGSRASRKSSGGSASIFEDDDDLFADSASSAAPAKPTPPPAAPPSPAAPPKPAAPPRPATPPTPAAAPKPAAAPPTPPAAPKPAPSSSDDLFDDDDDLFGDSSSAPEPVKAPPPSNPAPSNPAASNVVEFEDEVVEVERAAPPPKPAPLPSRSADPVVEVRATRQEPVAGKKPAADGGEVSGVSGRILQYSKKSSGKNPLGDDLGQMSGGMRLLIVIAVIAVGGGIVYGIMTAMQ